MARKGLQVGKSEARVPETLADVVHGTSAHSSHDLDHLRVIPLGVDRIRDLCAGVPERQLRRLEPEGLPDLAAALCRS